MLPWGINLRVGEIIKGLILLYPPKLILRLKISGGQKRQTDHLPD